MRFFRTFIILASLSFLLVEIWEPSTAFVRAGVVPDQGTCLHPSAKSGPKSGTETLTEEVGLATPVPLESTPCSAAHASTLLFFAIFETEFSASRLTQFEKYPVHEGIHHPRKRPPISA